MPKVVGEASPSYLEDPEAPFLIERTAPGAKVLVSLRDPVERLYSHYLMMLNSRPGMGSFQEEIERGLALQHNRSLAVLAPDLGLYYEQVLRFRSVFGADRFKVILFEEFTADVPATLREVLDFLGIDHPVADFKATVYREFGVARGPIVRYLWGNRTISQAAEVLIPTSLRKFIRETFLVKKVPKPKMDAGSARISAALLRRGREPPADSARPAAALAQFHPRRQTTRRRRRDAGYTRRAVSSSVARAATNSSSRMHRK